MANVIIIGAGVAGLSAGIHALLSGHKASIYEKHFKAGGNLTGWDREGYHIDNCIHWLTGTNPVTKLYKMWEELGALGNVPIYQPESLFTFEKDGKKLSLYYELERLKREMLEISPEDKKETLSFIKAIKAFQKINGVAGKNCDKKSNLFHKICALPALAKYVTLSTKDLSERFKSDFLKGFIRCYMTDHFASLALIMVFATFTAGDGALPEGISTPMAERMTDRFTSLGGELHLSRGVSRINISNGKATSVVLEDSTEVSADYVIVTLDPASAFGSLLPAELMPKKIKKNYLNPNMRRFSSHHTAFACGKRELPFSGDTMLEIPEKYREEFSAKYIMAREFSHEKSFAPEGNNVIQTMVYCMEDDSKAFIELAKDKDAYRAHKESLARHTEEIITEYYPELQGTLKCLDVWTPATYRRYVGSEIGSFMSFILPPKTMYKKLSGRIEGLKNVLLATQWQQNPGGLPIAAESGIRAIKCIK